MAYKPSPETLARAALARSKMSAAGKATTKPGKEEAGKSAAAAKRIKVAPRKAVEIKPGSVRAINQARQDAYKGRQPIGATGSGGNSVMAGSNMSTAKGIVAGIKAGYNPRVSLNPYEGMTAKEKKAMKKEEFEQIDEGAASHHGVAIDNSRLDKPKNISGLARKHGGQHVYRDPHGSVYVFSNKDGAKSFKDVVGSAASHIKADQTRKIMKMKELGEDVEQIDEGSKAETEKVQVSKTEAEKVLGGPVSKRPEMTPGKQPAGYRYVRSLARKAMKAGLKREDVEVIETPEVVVEQDDSMEKKEMAQTQLHFIKYAAEEILAFIDMGGEIEEWYQNKLSKVQSEVESLHSYIEGEKRRTGMVKEEEEQIDEKAPPGAKYERMVKHIKTGYAKGGLTKQEKGIAYATAWKAYNKAKNEEVETEETAEQIDEISNKTLKSYLKKKHTQIMQDLGAAKSEREKNKIRSAHDRETKPAELRVAAYDSGRRGDLTYHGVGDDPHGPLDKILKKKYKEGQKNMTKSGQAFQKRLAKQGIVSDEFVAEAEGKVAVSPKEKALAAHHGDKSKITYGDVIKARIKSAAEKAIKGKE